MRLSIPQAMLWKYGAKCSKTEDGTYIDSWEHPTEPKPTKTQMDIDVAEYETYIASSQYEEDVINKDIGITKKDKMLFEIDYDQENRVRVLEGKANITKQQYKNAIITIYKTL